nr:zinc finger protein 525 isoform X2 [Drosophila kikkawai]
MEVQICRACLGTSPVMINIFDNAPGLGISIADMITQCTPYEISEEDCYPENICDSCLHCARAAFEIRQTIETSHQIYLQMKNTKNLPVNVNHGVGFSERKKKHKFLKSSSHKSILNAHVGEKPHKCSHCSKSFSAPIYLQRHIRTHTGERPYKCSHCSKSFSQKSSFTAHNRNHTGERPFKCSHCSKSFSQRGTLNVHIRSHTKERPYKCSHCSKSFSQKSNLTAHNRNHTGERPFKCSHCSKSFTHKTTLNAHIRTHTGERPYKCSHCSKSFSHKNTLNFHIRTHIQ